MLTTKFSVQRALRLLFAVAAFTLIAAGCSIGSDDMDTSAGTAGSFDAADSGGDGAADDGGGSTEPALVDESSSGDGGGDDGAATDDGSSEPVQALPVALQPVDIGRDIIYTAQVDVEVDDVSLASASVVRSMQALGALLFSEQTDATRSVLTFKVFPTDFQDALGRIGETGTVVNQSVSSDDVTERIVDLQSRITTSAASVERLRGFLANATDLNTVAELENQLLQRETVLEQLRGQLRTVEAQVDLATIVVTLRPAPESIIEPGVRLAVGLYAGHDGGAGCDEADARLDVDRGDPVSVCYTVTNSGEASLTDLDIRDEALELRNRDLEVVSGSLDEALAPGGVVVLVHELEPDKAFETAAVVRATPVDAAGAPTGEPITDRADGARATGFGGLDLPGFGDALSGSWSALRTVIGFLVLAVAVVIPFLWILPLLLIGRAVARRRRGVQAPYRPPTDPAPAPEPIV